MKSFFQFEFENQETWNYFCVNQEDSKDNATADKIK